MTPPPGADPALPLKTYWLVRLRTLRYSCMYWALADVASSVEARRTVRVSVPLPVPVSPWYQEPAFMPVAVGGAQVATGPALLLLPWTVCRRSTAKLVPQAD